MKVCCAECLGFIKDTVGDGKGIGKCKVYEHYADKGLNKDQLDNLLVELGGSKSPVFWGGSRKIECKRFKADNVLDVPLSQARSREY